MAVPTLTNNKRMNINTNISIGVIRISADHSSLAALGAEALIKEDTLFLNKKEIILTSDLWKIVIEVNVSTINADVSRLRATTLQAREHLLKSTEHLSELGVQVEEIDRVLGTEEELLGVSQTLADFLSHRRVRNGLVNLGGTVLKVLFGTSDSSDAEQIQLRLRDLDRQSSDLVHVQQQHITLTRELSRRTEYNTRMLNELATSFTLYLDQTRGRLKNTEENETTLALLLHTYDSSSTILRNLDLTAIKAHGDLRSLLGAMETIASESVGVVLMSVLIQLSRTLNRIAQLLPKGMEMVGGTAPADMYTYYDLAEVHAYSINYAPSWIDRERIYDPMIEASKDINIPRGNNPEASGRRSGRATE